ncbi:hypothetical protein [Paenibacillus shenyangensis]|uniref:hypothetical protein n=1 Tax=Paenibacillus sp. A9 TaxID=1284352 RepID=UPI000A7527C3|nr:hypothetical protein [Paenibacillus sp. A9]
MKNDYKSLYNIERLVVDLKIVIEDVQKSKGLINENEKLINTTNLVVDGVVLLNKLIEKELINSHDDKIISLINDIAYNLEEMIVNYNNDVEIEAIFNTYEKVLNPLFEEFKNAFYEYSTQITKKKNLVISGINYLSVNIHKLINTDKYRVVAYLTNDNNYVGQTIEDMPILIEENLSALPYHYIINTDNLHVTTNHPTFDLIAYINSNYDYEIYKAYAELKELKEELDGFITGLSYAEVAFNTQELQPLKVANVAVSSQDIRQDYNWAKLITENYASNKLKFAIIGLSYYSFEYDLSKSKSKKHRLPMYSSLFEKDDLFSMHTDLPSDVLIENFSENLFYLLREKDDNWWYKYIAAVMGDKEIEQGREIAERDSNKNYPETVENNFNILKEYIEMLQKHNIQPILVVCPTSAHYYSHFSKRIETEFLEKITDLRNVYNIDFINLFTSDLFNDQDFYDVSHLNEAGAKKFTKYVLNYIQANEVN